MADRLEELRKQRALVQQHLTWLDHEIAAMTVTRLTLPPFAMRSGTRPPVPGATTAPINAPAAGMAVPELSEFQVDPDNVQGDTRRGCIIYSALAFVIMVLICVIIYFVGYRDNPVLMVPEKGEPAVVYPGGQPKPHPVAPVPAPPAKPVPASATPPKK